MLDLFIDGSYNGHKILKTTCKGFEGQQFKMYLHRIDARTMIMDSAVECTLVLHCILIHMAQIILISAQKAKHNI